LPAAVVHRSWTDEKSSLLPFASLHCLSTRLHAANGSSPAEQLSKVFRTLVTRKWMLNSTSMLAKKTSSRNFPDKKCVAKSFCRTYLSPGGPSYLA
jgi:hypothetical protein